MTKRRDFIKKSALGTVGLAIGGMGFSSKSYAKIIGANDRINIAVIGIGGRGSAHINAFCGMKDSHNVRVITMYNRSLVHGVVPAVFKTAYITPLLKNGLALQFFCFSV
jgi:hypothetical protein